MSDRQHKSAVDATAATTTEQDEGVGSGVQIAQAMLSRGQADPATYADLVRRRPAERDAIFALLQRTIGNAFVQAVVADLRSAPTGIAGVDAAGKKRAGSGYFLDGDQRGALVGYYQGRVNAAKDDFTGALSDVWADVTAESDTELNPIVGIVLNILAGSASLALQSAAKLLASSRAAETALSAVNIHGVKVGEEMSDVAEGRLEVIVGSAIDQAKDSAKPAANAATTATADAKSTEKSFLDAVSDQAGDAFQHVREDPPGQVNDAEMLRLFAAWDIKYHRRAEVRERLEKQLRRYMGSQASKLGRKITRIDRGVTTTERELGVAFVKGETTQLLAYVGQDFEVAGSDYARAGAYTSAPMLSLDDDAHARDGGAISKPVPQGRPMFLGWVEEDLRDAAIAKHEAVWQASPKTYTFGMLMYGGGSDVEVHDGAKEEIP